jgi:hypothetical protein
MKKNHNSRFWMILATINVLTVVYPVHLLAQAEDSDEKALAVFAIAGIAFLLMVVDAVSIVVAEAIGETKR